MGSALGQAIREARLASRLTQKQLAGRLGVAERAVLRWEQHGRIRGA